MTDFYEKESDSIDTNPTKEVNQLASKLDGLQEPTEFGSQLACFRVRSSEDLEEPGNDFIRISSPSDDPKVEAYLKAPQGWGRLDPLMLKAFGGRVPRNLGYVLRDEVMLHFKAMEIANSDLLEEE